MSLVQDFVQLDDQMRVAPAFARHCARLSSITVECHSDPLHIKSDWQVLKRQSALPFMSYAWAKAWFADVAERQNQQPVIVIGHDDRTEPLFLLPLVLEQRGPFRVLLWPGGTHAAYHCGLFSRDCRALVRSEGPAAFWQRVFAALPRADALVAYGLPELDAEGDNPLRALPFTDTGCTSHRFALAPDWEALYATKCTAKLRRDERRCERRLGELGDVEFTIAESADEKLKLIDCMLDQKSRQLRAVGAPDFTTTDGVRDFYRRLATSPDWEAKAEVLLCALTINGVPVAVNLALIEKDCVYGLILSMGDGEAARFGPGRQLLRRVIAHCCARGLATFDLGAGEDPSKLRWEDSQVRRRDVLVPLSPQGRLFIWGMRAFFAVKGTIKSSPVLWRMFSRYRRYLGC